MGDVFYPNLTQPTLFLFLSTLAVGLFTASSLFLRRLSYPILQAIGLYLTAFLLGITLLHHDRARLSSLNERKRRCITRW